MSKLELKPDQPLAFGPTVLLFLGTWKWLVGHPGFIGHLGRISRRFAVVILKAGGSPVHLEGDSFRDASIHIIF